MAEIENLFEFRAFDKIARLSREVVVSEKLDGTNAQVCIVKREEAEKLREAGVITPVALFVDAEIEVYAGSRNRWLTLSQDNYGFAGWVSRNVEELKKLGPGRHYGEWWGNGIQRKYGLKEKRFSLFNTSRWFPVDPTNSEVAGVWTPHSIQPEPDKIVVDMGPACCYVVPVIWRGIFDSQEVENFCDMLRIEGSFAARGFMDPEGVVIYHTAANLYFKKTLKNDETPKSLVK